jgi:hypothetical protein
MKVGFLFESGMNQSISEVVKIEKQIRRISQTIPTHRLAPHPTFIPTTLWINDENDQRWIEHAGQPRECRTQNKSVLLSEVEEPVLSKAEGTCGCPRRCPFSPTHSNTLSS